MKNILIFTLIIAYFPAKSQFFNSNPDSFFNINCGTWEAQTPYYTEWETLDTIGNAIIKDTARVWVYDGERMIVSNMATAVYCPCGCREDIKWAQKRVCKITGIRQVRYKIQRYKYIEPDKTEYEKAIDSLRKL